MSIWNSLSPDGTKSVKQNTTPMGQNTTYTETNMNKDHFWNIGTDEDGHHKAVQMENYADTGIGAPADPVLSTGMDLALYSRLINGANQPFARNINSIMQILGIRAYAVWNNTGGPDPTNQTLVNSFNVTSVARQIAGRYEVTFATILPSENYLFYASGMGSSDNGTFDSLYGSVASGQTLAARKNGIKCVFMMRTQSGSLANALQGWLFCFGG